ncbi:MAG: DUF2914 domain-containing protein [Candidatus Rokubacteria bacterium]|nr:DUF2914 domain-containing protein [Candidatus Rokubacteria bacterium]
MCSVIPSWLGRWGASVASLLLGLATLFVFRRGLPHVGWIVGYLILLWLIVAVVAEVQAPVGTRGRRLALQAAEYTIQTLYHNLLLFVLPAYYASATLTSVNALFLAGVAAAALVTAVDPWYRALVPPRRWLKTALLGFSVFAALNVALPLVSVRPIIALEGGAALAALSLSPTLRRPGAARWRRAYLRAAALALVAALAVWLGRGLVPPAPLFLARAAVAREVSRLEPVDEARGAVRAATVVGWGGLVAYTAVHAPVGLSQAIEHVWRRDGRVLARIRLSPVQGGRAEGFRTWSRRTDLTPPLAGRYAVDVMTASGQLIGRLRFTVTP